MPWAPDYVDEATLIDFVRANADNAYVGTYGTAASRAVDGACNRQFGQLDAAGTFTYQGWRAIQLRDGRWLLEVDDLQDITGLTVAVDGQAVTAGVDGYQLWPRNAIAMGGVVTAITLPADPGNVDVDVTGLFGWTAIPAGATAATWLQVNRWNIRRESPYGTAGAPADGSQVSLYASLDPDVRTILAASGLTRARMPR